jgi:hypothetical protein
MSTVFRIQKNNGYTVMSNYHLFDEQLSAKATTYLSLMLALPPTWDYTLTGLTTLKKDGLASVRAAINELEECGYISRKQLRDSHGRLSHNEYLVYETPELNPDYKPKENNSKKIKKTNKKLNKTCENTHFEPSCDFPSTEKPSAEKPLAENRTQSNTNLSNTNLSNTNLSVCHRAEKADEKNSAKKDRPTDRLPQKTFSEILDDINYHSYAINENDEPDAEAVMKCSIPYSYNDNKKAMKKALAFLFGFNFYSQGMEEQDKDLFSQVIALITELTTYEKSKVGKCYVKYYEVIDKLNELIKHNMLYDWFLSFIPEWTSICQEREIKNVRAYLKSCIWSWLNEYDFVENYQINGIIKSNHQLNSSKINENTSKIDFQSVDNETTPQKETRHHKPVNLVKSDVAKSGKKAVPSQSELNGDLRHNSESSVISSETSNKADTEPVRDYEIDYVLKDGKTENDIQKIFLSKDLTLDEKAEWLDKFVENWRNSEANFCLSSIKRDLNLSESDNHKIRSNSDKNEESEDEFMNRRKRELLAQLKQVNT